MNTILPTLIALFMVVLPFKAHSDSPLVDYYATLSFRESPYAPHKGVHRLTRKQAQTRNHYRFAYDDQGRISRITFQLGDQLRPPNHTANYFWYASGETYAYEGNVLKVRYLDQYGEYTTVHGGIATSVYTLDDHGKRLNLTFLGPDNKAMENAWDIARYQWRHQHNGGVVENRFNLNAQPVSLRPGFAFSSVRLHYDVNGYIKLMQNVDDQGNVRATDTGFAQDSFTMSRHGELLRYDVLSTDDEPISANMQGIASGVQTFTPFGYEAVSTYLDHQQQPVRNDYGWWRSERRYDAFGNLVFNQFQTLSAVPADNPNTGYATAIITWHEDGINRKSLRYFDENSQPVSHQQRGYHGVYYRYDDADRLQRIELRNHENELVDHAQQGWAVRLYQYPEGATTPKVQSLTKAEAGQDALSQLLHDVREITRVPGMAAAIAKEGKLLWHGESGFANIAQHRPIEATTLFRLASVSKAVTSMLVGQQLDQGSLSLKTRATDILPTNHTATLAQLLAHTGSVAHYQPWIRSGLDRTYPNSMAALKVVPPYLLKEQPGTQYRYSTFGYSMVGAMLEQATSQSFDALLQALHTPEFQPKLYTALSAPPNQLTTFYDITNDAPALASPRNFSYSSAGAGLISNAADLARLASHFAAQNITTETTLQALLTPAKLRDGSVVEAGRYAVGLGWREQQSPAGRTYHHHAGVTDGARSVVIIDPETSLSFVLLSNAAWSADMFSTGLAFLHVHEQRGPALQDHASLLFREKENPVAFHRDKETSVWQADMTTPGHAIHYWLSGSGRGAQMQIRKYLNKHVTLSPFGVSPVGHIKRLQQTGFEIGSKSFLNRFRRYPALISKPIRSSKIRSIPALQIPQEPVKTPRSTWRFGCAVVTAAWIKTGFILGNRKAANRGSVSSCGYSLDAARAGGVKGVMSALNACCSIVPSA